jgi:hypothetical protein
VRRELSARADGHGPGELLGRDGLVSQRVHAHGDLEVVEVVEEEAEVLELVEGDAAQPRGLVRLLLICDGKGR